MHKEKTGVKTPVFFAMSIDKAKRKLYNIRVYYKNGVVYERIKKTVTCIDGGLRGTWLCLQ